MKVKYKKLFFKSNKLKNCADSCNPLSGFLNDFKNHSPYCFVIITFFVLNDERFFKVLSEIISFFYLFRLIGCG